VVSGRSEEGIPPLETALRLDPRNPAKATWLAYMSWLHFGARRYEEAVDWAKKSVRENRDTELAYRALAASYAQLGRVDEARAAVAQALRIDPELTLEKVKGENARVNPDFDPDFTERQIDGLRKAGLPE
jgi:tetratricopeptide (TPR) repeat protein